MDYRAADVSDRAARAAKIQSAVMVRLATAPTITTSSPERNRFDAADALPRPNRVSGVVITVTSAPARVRALQVEPDWLSRTARIIARLASPLGAEVGVVAALGTAGAVSVGAELTAVQFESSDRAAVTPKPTAIAVMTTATAIAAVDAA